MNDPELIDEARGWLRFATEDLEVARGLLIADEAPSRTPVPLLSKPPKRR